MLQLSAAVIHCMSHHLPGCSKVLPTSSRTMVSTSVEVKAAWSSYPLETFTVMPPGPEAWLEGSEAAAAALMRQAATSSSQPCRCCLER